MEAVYSYYGGLFRDHPYLLWAGMASLIGPAFYAGFSDLGFVPDAVRRTVIATFGRASRRLARNAAGDLGFYEKTFLSMQKKIFEDQATMHEAYLAGGIPQLEEFYRTRIIDLATLTAWKQIDTGRGNGNATAVADGNRALLFREQHDIIDRFYLQMLGHRGPEGPAFTYLLTLAGAPSIPGAHSYPEQYPLTLTARLPRGAIRAQTPLADGNIAIFANRWRLIDDDTLPSYLAFVRDHPEQALDMVDTPIRTRMACYRLRARARGLAAASLTRWHVDVTASPSPVFGARTAPVRVAAARPVIDLSRPPTRESAGFAAGARSRIWMNSSREPVEVTVNLPDGRAYQVRATMAAILSPAGTGDPDRLTVQLPVAGLVATEALMAQYAATWGFPAREVASWSVRVAPSAPADPNDDDTGLFTYGTRVFTSADVGFVHLEFQVAHHQREGEFVVTALFTWDRPALRSGG